MKVQQTALRTSARTEFNLWEEEDRTEVRRKYKKKQRRQTGRDIRAVASKVRISATDLELMESPTEATLL